jgi:hypothetical protein
LVASVPVQPLLAVQVVALVLDHVSVELLPEAMAVGLAESVTVGAGVLAVMVTVTVCETAVPLDGVTVSV